MVSKKRTEKENVRRSQAGTRGSNEEKRVVKKKARKKPPAANVGMK